MHTTSVLPVQESPATHAVVFSGVVLPFSNTTPLKTTAWEAKERLNLFFKTIDTNAHRRHFI